MVSNKDKYPKYIELDGKEIKLCEMGDIMIRHKISGQYVWIESKSLDELQKIIDEAKRLNHSCEKTRE